ncbi:MAG: hypothetical protein V7605_884 [Acidimicrobiaceae bacterium]|jgi:steroid 5-alpha reductase family enzyme
MESETVLMWSIALAVGAVVVAVVALLLWLLWESVRSLDSRVDRIWSAAVGVFVHTAATGRQLDQAHARALTLGGPR